ncbi:MAG: GWxTD domain-containing protein [Bacteroidales bacterium]|nr:GWxTD domain-containing protein [Bacteroidales bacterium]
MKNNTIGKVLYLIAFAVLFNMSQTSAMPTNSNKNYLTSDSVSLNKLVLNFNCLKFDMTKDSAYIELQFLFIGNSMNYIRQTNGKYQASVRVNIQLMAEGNDTINVHQTFYSETYDNQSNEDKNNLYDLLRIPLKKGIYDFNIAIYDNANLENQITYSDRLDLSFPNNIVTFSSIQPITYQNRVEEYNKYTKYGWEYLPYFSNYYPEVVNSLSYWVEINNTESVLGHNKSFTVFSKIVSADDIHAEPLLSKQKTYTTDIRCLLMQNYNIESLSSGNYLLQMEVRDEWDTIHAYTSYFFQRNNPLAFENLQTNTMSYDTLKKYFDYISVIATPAEHKFIDNFTPEQLEDGILFFYNFWKSRDENHPVETWYEYHNRVLRVNNNYSTLRYKGYRTDRGQCYLKYGPPSDIEYHNFDGNTYPYEIWYYNSVPNGQVNVYFVFYNLDRTTKDYRLLHSTVYGEAKFSDWENYVKTGSYSIGKEDSGLDQENHTTNF